MLFHDRIVTDFCFAERAELLGAVFGDGSIEKRGHKGYKVSVGVSDTWPAWKARVPILFEKVFGRVYERAKKTSPAGVTYYEYHVTTHDPVAIFGVQEKYDSLGRIVPPDWLAHDPEFLRRFILGLVETDGYFGADASDGTPTFGFAQANDHLSAWFTETLCRLGFPCFMKWHATAGVNQPQIHRSEDTSRFGEWLQSEKWIALKESGHGHRSMVVNRKMRGAPVVPRDRVVLKSVDSDEQEKWRAWRMQGASILAIARHVGRSNNVVYMAVRDIVPTTTKTAEDLGLKPLARIPKRSLFSSEVVEEWRRRATEGESSKEIAESFNIREGIVSDATADIRWDQLMSKMALHKQKLSLMKSEPQGQGRWASDKE